MSRQITGNIVGPGGSANPGIIKLTAKYNTPGTDGVALASSLDVTVETDGSYTDTVELGTYYVDWTPTGGLLTRLGVASIDAGSATDILTLIDASQAPRSSVLGIAYGGTGASTVLGAQQNLSLEPGVDVQAYDATLQSLSALGTTANRIAYTTGTNAWAETTLTAYSRTLLDDVDSTAWRSTLGLGSMATQNSTNVDVDGGTINATTIGLTNAADASFVSVGIGTSSPSYELHIEDASTPTLGLIDTTNNCIVTLAAANTSAVLNTGSNHDLVLGSNSTAVLTIDTSQNVGIGVASPDTKLHVLESDGAGATPNANAQLAIEANGTSGLQFVGGASPTQYIWFVDSVANNTNYFAYTHGSTQFSARFEGQDRFILDASGSPYAYFRDNVGIGIASPDGKLHVHSATAGAITASVDADELVLEGSTNSGLSILSGVANLGSIFFGDSGDNDIGAIQYNHSTNVLGIATNATNALNIDSAQNVGIGVTPETGWSSTHVAWELGGSGTAMCGKTEAVNNGLSFSENVYYDGTDWKPKFTDSGGASTFTIGDGGFIFRVSNGGVTADVAFTPFNALTIDNSGDIVVKNSQSENTFQVSNTINGAQVIIGEGATNRVIIDGRASQNSYFNSGGNVGIGTSTFGTSAAGVLGLNNATAPTTGVANTIQIYSDDLTAGNTTLCVRTEGGGIVSSPSPVPTADTTIALKVNGTTYYVLASTTP